jgi:chaperone modulatory protein CbpM
MNAPTTEWSWLDARQAVSLQELARISGLTPQEITELVEYGELQALDPGAAQPAFGADWAVPLREAAQLRRDFDLELFAAGLLVRYLRRIAVLERQLKSARAQMPAFAHPRRADMEHIHIRIRQEWALLSDEDIAHGLKHRENFLDRLRHRHNLGLDEAERQLHAFEKKNPELLFEKS